MPLEVSASKVSALPHIRNSRDSCPDLMLLSFVALLLFRDDVSPIPVRGLILHISCVELELQQQSNVHHLKAFSFNLQPPRKDHDSILLKGSSADPFLSPRIRAMLKFYGRNNGPIHQSDG